MAMDIGIDLGSSKTVIFSNSKLLVEHPSVVTVDAQSYEPKYFGEDAKKTIGRISEGYECVFPIVHGLISDYDVAEEMLKRYITEAFGNNIVRPRIIATLPTGITELQYHSLNNVLEAAGCRNVTIIESPLAVALGLNIDFAKPDGNMIVDIGAGSTDIAVISMGGIVECDAYKTASADFDDLIIDYIRKSHNIVIGALTAENIKKQIGQVYPRPVTLTATSKGRNMFSGLPETFEVTSDEIYDAIKPCADKICKAIAAVIEKTEPDLVADIHKNGIYLCGGGSEIFGMAELIEQAIGVKVIRVENPAYAVVRGAVAGLKKPHLLRNINYQLRAIKELEVK